MTKPRPDDGDDQMSEHLDKRNALDVLLVQPADHSDRFHPHSQIRASADVQPDIDRLESILSRFRSCVLSGESLPLSRADSLGGEASRLILRIKNRLTEDAEPEAITVKRSCPWSAK